MLTAIVFCSSNNAKYLKFCGGKVESTRNGNFNNYPGDIRLRLFWRQGDTVQNLESPGLSRRVDSTASHQKIYSVL